MQAQELEAPAAALEAPPAPTEEVLVQAPTTLLAEGEVPPMKSLFYSNLTNPTVTNTGLYS